METLITLSNVVVFLILIIHPVFVLSYLKKKNKFSATNFFIISVLVSLLLCLVSVWWFEEGQNNILLNYYGFNREDMYNGDPFKSVTKENLSKVEKLYDNMFGLGWPIKAVVSYIFYFPYLLLMYLIFYFTNKYFIKKTAKTK